MILGLPLFVAIFVSLTLPRFWLPNLFSSSFSNLYLSLVPDFFSLFYYFLLVCSPFSLCASFSFFPSHFTFSTELSVRALPSPQTKPKVRKSLKATNIFHIFAWETWASSKNEIYYLLRCYIGFIRVPFNNLYFAFITAYTLSNMLHLHQGITFSLLCETFCTLFLNFNHRTSISAYIRDFTRFQTFSMM